jgi:hypothetical protein
MEHFYTMFVHHVVMIREIRIKIKMEYDCRWRWTAKYPEYANKKCRVIKRIGVNCVANADNKVEIEFENGEKIVVNRNAIRRAK